MLLRSARRRGLTGTSVTRARGAAARALTLVVDVLVLVHLPVHVRVRVRVYVRVDLRVDLGGPRGASLSQQQLLAGDVVLVRKTIFVPVGRLRRRRRAGSIPVGRCGRTLAGGESGGGGGGGGAGALGLAEPQQGGAQDEGDTRRNPDDDGPGEAGRCCRGDGVVLRLQICKERRRK